MNQQTDKAADGGLRTTDLFGSWPDAPGFYWWRGAPSFRWEMMQVWANGADDDSTRYVVKNVECYTASRSLQMWKERGPECGEWVKIRQPETLAEMEARRLREHACEMNRDMMGKCFVCGSSSLPNITNKIEYRKGKFYSSTYQLPW